MIGITVTDDQGGRQELSFDAPRIRIGRDADNDVVLDSPACSRHHAEIVREAGAYKIVDLGSTNGIQVGDTRVPDLFLIDGTSVVLGVHTLTFSLAESAEEKTLLLGRDVKAAAAAPRPEKPEKPEKPTEPAALYLVFRERGQKRNLKIVAGARYVIGRSPDSDLVIDHGSVSKRHATVFWEGESFHLRDMDSANGTLLNGKKIVQRPLAVGDEILIGNQVIVVRDQLLDLEDDALLLGKTRLGIPTLDLGRPRERRAPESEGRREGRRLGPALFVVAVLLLAAGAYFVLRERPAAAPAVEREGVARQAPEAAAGSLIVRVAPVEAKELTRVVDGSGTVRPHRKVTVSAEIAGRVLEVAVDEGWAVEAGQLLARLNDADIRLQLQEARSAVSKDRVDLARAEHERMQRLFDDGVASQALVDQARSQLLALESAYEAGQARARQLQEQLRKASITAPFSGRVAKRFVDPGEFLAPGGPVVTIENMDEILIELEVPDRDIVKVNPGQQIEATADAFPGRVFRGVVDSTATAANPVTRTFKVEARIDNRDGSLRSGMISAVRILLEESSALVVPVEGLIDGGETEAAVFVVADGMARRRSVRLGQRWDREVEVLEGLAPGDEVVVGGKERLRDGEPVQIYRDR